MKTGIVLSGGGARGIAHLGVLKALKDKNIKLDHITGTSAGAIAGALYANDIDPYDVLQIILKTNLLKLLKLSLGKPGLLNIESSYSLFKELLPHDSFDELKIKLTITATNFNNGELEYFNKGDHLIKKVLASSCIPGFFNPININNNLYLDGGILNNFPTEPLLNNCDVIIGSSCNHLPVISEAKGLKHILERTAVLTINHDIKEKYKHVDILIEPENLGERGVFEIGKGEEIYWTAYEAALQKINSNNLLESLSNNII